MDININQFLDSNLDINKYVIALIENDTDTMNAITKAHNTAKQNYESYVTAYNATSDPITQQAISCLVTPSAPLNQTRLASEIAMIKATNSTTDNTTLTTDGG